MMVMRVFVAGGSGVLGQRLVPQLLARGHQVTATTTTPSKLALLKELGAEGVVMDGLDPVSVGEAVAAARPDAIVHQMTALSIAKYGRPSFRHPERFAATTNRLRTEGTDNLLAAAEATGVPHMVAQSVAIWYGGSNGGKVTEAEFASPQGLGPKVRPAVESGRHVEDVVVKAGGAVLRYGGFYGPGATDDHIELVRKRWFPLIGDGSGYFSWVHLDDAASATVLAVEQKATGLFNIVDDEPAQVRDWLPYLAELIGAKKPRRVPGWLARLLAGDMIIVMTQRRGFSNARARRDLGWVLRYPSWRQGFKEALT
jgi:nucleoside-diphosphate-sugar epimerase